MTNKSIALLANMQTNSYEEKKQVIKEVLTIEYKKIIAQAKNFVKLYDKDNVVKNILNTKDSEELFFFLDHLSVIEISILSAYGIDVAFMNLLKVSE